MFERVIKWIILVGAVIGNSLVFQNCSPAQFQDSINEASISSNCPNNTTPECLDSDEIAQNLVCSFNGHIYYEGESVVAYLASSAPSGKSCISEIRRCVGGALTGAYPYSECSVDAPESCLFNGRTIAHGQNIEAYLNSSVTYGQSCTKQSRTCNNGVLNGSYNFSSCTVGSAASCLFNGQTVPHGGSVAAFQNSSVAYGQSCTKQSRTCNNGVLNGSYNFSSCTMGSAASCLFNGQTVPHGGSVAAFQKSSVFFGQTCQSETRFCQNGTLTGSNSYASCAIESPRGCLFGGRTLAHGENVVAYLNSIEPYGQNCKQQLRYCQDGLLSGSYNHSSCTIRKSVCVPLKVAYSRTGIALQGNHCQRKVMYERTFTNPYNATAIFNIDVRYVDDTYLIDDQEVKPNQFLRFNGDYYKCNAPHADRFSKVVGPSQTVKLSVADNHGTAASIDATVCFEGL